MYQIQIFKEILMILVYWFNIVVREFSMKIRVQDSNLIPIKKYKISMMGEFVRVWALKSCFGMNY